MGALATSDTSAHAQIRRPPLRRLMRFLRNPENAGYLFIAPWFIGFCLFTAGPLLTMFYNSFTNYDLFGDSQFIGAANYVRILTRDPVWREINWHMLVYVIGSTIITTGLGLFFAVLLARDFPGNHIFRVIVYVPTLLVGVATGMLFFRVFANGEVGLANIVLGWFHLPPVNWLQNFDNPWLGILTLILVNIWFVGNAMLIFIAGLKGISPTYYEAAQLDGATRFRIFRSVTLPLLSPVLVLNTILILIGHIQVFDTPLSFAAASGGGLSTTDANPLGFHDSLGTYLVYIYQQGFIENNFGYASALGVIVFVITLLLALVVLWGSSRFTYYGDLNSN